MAHFLCILLLGALLPGVVAAAEAAPSARYSLRDTSWERGGALGAKIAQGSVPFEKTYRELTPEQQDYLKSQYERMGPADEPPYPSNGLKPIILQLVRALKTFPVEGQLTLYVQVDSEGKALSVAVIKSPDSRMSQVVASILMFETYKPARCDGTPCAMQFPFYFDLRLR